MCHWSKKSFFVLNFCFSTTSIIGMVWIVERHQDIHRICLRKKEKRRTERRRKREDKGNGELNRSRRRELFTLHLYVSIVSSLILNVVFPIWLTWCIVSCHDLIALGPSWYFVSPVSYLLFLFPLPGLCLILPCLCFAFVLYCLALFSSRLYCVSAYRSLSGLIYLIVSYLILSFSCLLSCLVLCFGLSLGLSVGLFVPLAVVSVCVFCTSLCGCLTPTKDGLYHECVWGVGSGCRSCDRTCVTEESVGQHSCRASSSRGSRRWRCREGVCV